MRLPNPEFWEGKRVFVTGARGFKGKWLVIWLEKMGAIIETNDTFDIRDTQSMHMLFEKFAPEIVIHMAAISTVQQAFENPILAVDVNTLGTLSVLEALRDIKSVKAILNVTTDKVYHMEGIDRGYTENDPLGGLEIYAASKVCSEILSQVYTKTFNFPLVTARAGNVIGGGDWKKSRLIPNYYFASIEGNTLDVNNNAVRPWQYVLDCLCGYLLLCERLYANNAYKGSWNFASDEFESRSVQWVVDEMNNYFLNPVKYNLIEDRGYYETKVLKINSEKAQKVLKWEPKYTIEEAVARTAYWYMEYMRGQPLEYLHEQEICA